MTALQPIRHRRALAAFLVAVAAVGCQAGGLDIHADADAADVGLPAYPGAVKKAEHDHNPSGFSFGIWGESFGVKIAVVSYRSVDSVDAVATFYRDALAKYGPVLDCSANRKKGDAPPQVDRKSDKKTDKDAPIACEDDTVEAGGRLYKVGTHRSQRVFKVRPWHDGASFELVRVEQHGTDD